MRPAGRGRAGPLALLLALSFMWIVLREHARDARGAHLRRASARSIHPLSALLLASCVFMAHLTPLVAQVTHAPSARVSGSARRGVWTQTEAHRESYGGTPFAPFTPMVDSGNALQSEPGAESIASELTILRGAGVKAVQSEPIDAGDSTEASTKHGRGLQATPAAAVFVFDFETSSSPGWSTGGGDPPYAFTRGSGGT